MCDHGVVFCSTSVPLAIDDLQPPPSGGTGKTKEVLKEGIASAMGLVSAELFTTTSRTKKEAEEYAGKLTEQEREAGRLYKAISKYTSEFPSAPAGEDARTSKQLAKIHRQFMIMRTEYDIFSKELVPDVTYQLPSGANHNLLQWPDDFFSGIH